MVEVLQPSDSGLTSLPPRSHLVSMAAKRTCLIVGATTGIGKETAEHLAKKGWTVIVTGRNEHKGTMVGLGLTEFITSS